MYLNEGETAEAIALARASLDNGGQRAFLAKALLDAIDARDAESEDPVTLTFQEVRENIEAVRAMYPGRSDREIALAMLKATDGRADTREETLVGLVASVMHFAAKHAR